MGETGKRELGSPQSDQQLERGKEKRSQSNKTFKVSEEPSTSGSHL
jgi:hypothetical protein